MENWLSIIHEHASHSHWFIFGGALLAGLNVPISIDLLMIISATLAATVAPHMVVHLFLAIFLGCLFSAWISYWVGRLLGPKLVTWPLFSKIFSPKVLKKVKDFNKKRGHFALILGRFIPFGVRNCLYMSNGMSRVPFYKFALWEGLACSLWSIGTFSLYYALGKNIDRLYSQVKFVNLLIFAAFSVTVIGIIWYKKKKRSKEGNV